VNTAIKIGIRINIVVNCYKLILRKVGEIITLRAIIIAWSFFFNFKTANIATYNHEIIDSSFT